MIKLVPLNNSCYDYLSGVLLLPEKLKREEKNMNEKTTSRRWGKKRQAF